MASDKTTIAEAIHPATPPEHRKGPSELAQAAERHDYLGPARERGRAELSIPLPIVVVVRGVVAALEPGYSSFVIAGENSAVIEAGEAPRHGVHFTGPSREDHTTQVTYRAPGWAASSACRWVTW